MSFNGTCCSTILFFQNSTISSDSIIFTSHSMALLRHVLTWYYLSNSTPFSMTPLFGAVKEFLIKWHYSFSTGYNFSFQWYCFFFQWHYFFHGTACPFDGTTFHGARSSSSLSRMSSLSTAPSTDDRRFRTIATTNPTTNTCRTEKARNETIMYGFGQDFL